MGFLITHNEAISIADYFSIHDKSGVCVYRPTVHYAYHPCDDAVLSLHELAATDFEGDYVEHCLGESEIDSGADELGVLLMGHKKTSYWFVNFQLSVTIVGLVRSWTSRKRAN